MPCSAGPGPDVPAPPDPWLSSGTALRDFLQVEYGHHPQVKRLLRSPDGGATDLVLQGNDGMIEEVRLCSCS